MSAPAAPARTVSRSADVAAAPEEVLAVVSDLPGMGRLSPENTGGRWTGGATGPRVGATFRGTNRRGARRWSTAAVVTAYEPGRAFAFDVAALGLPVARWSYEVAAVPGGSRVTETWTDRRGVLLRRLGGLLTGVGDREAYTARSIEQTLAAVKGRLEA